MIINNSFTKNGFQLSVIKPNQLARLLNLPQTLVKAKALEVSADFLDIRSKSAQQ